MAPEEKPYRVYRGGRAKGKVPTTPRPGRQQSTGGRRRGDADGERAPTAARARRRPAAATWRRRTALGASVVFIAGRRLGVRELLLVLERRRRTRTSASTRTPRPRSTTRAACCSRTRRRSSCSAPTTTRSSPAAPATSTPTRSCSCAPTHRITGSTTSRSRATCRCRFPVVDAEDQRGVPDRRRGARDQDDPAVHRSRDQPRDGRQLRRLQGSDRRARRDHRQRAEADPLEPLRLPVRDARRSATSGRAGASARARST